MTNKTTAAEHIACRDCFQQPAGLKAVGRYLRFSGEGANVRSRVQTARRRRRRVAGKEGRKMTARGAARHWGLATGGHESARSAACGSALTIHRHIHATNLIAASLLLLLLLLMAASAWDTHFRRRTNASQRAYKSSHVRCTPSKQVSNLYSAGVKKSGRIFLAAPA